MMAQGGFAANVGQVGNQVGNLRPIVNWPAEAFEKSTGFRLCWFLILSQLPGTAVHAPRSHANPVK